MFWSSRRASPRPSSSTRDLRSQNPAIDVIAFDGRRVKIVRKPYRRSLSLTVQISGELKVLAPKSVPLARIVSFVESHREWINGQLGTYEELRSKHPPKTFSQGEEFLLLGQPHRLAFLPGTIERLRVKASEGHLNIEIPPNDWKNFDPRVPHPECAHAIVGFYEKVARELLAARLAVYSEKMGLKPSAVSIRAQKTRWGSCSSKGRISLNWRLLVAPLEVIDYVVVHELAHLKHYDHSKNFWALVGEQVPDYRKLREWLRAHQYEADFLAKRSELHL